MTDVAAMPRPGSRRWIAWKLVQLAYRLYDAEYAEHIVIRSKDRTISIAITGDLYGAGISSITGGGNSASLGFRGEQWHFNSPVDVEWIEAH